MDFFSAVRDGEQRAGPTDVDDVDAFAKAIAQRYGPSSSPSIVLTARLTPTTTTSTNTNTTSNPHSMAPPVPFPSSPMAKMTLASRPSATMHLPTSFTPVPPIRLPSYLDDSTTLIIDIRPHAAHSSARIPHALSLSVPSTLLKRPRFSLDRIAGMLPSQSASARFSAWPAAARILVYDADAAAVPASSNIHGLLHKFKLDGFGGELAWLQGGFQAVWRDRRDLIDTSPPTPEPDDDDDRPSAASLVPALRTKHLPMSAFSLSSTTAAAPPPLPPQSSKRSQNMAMSIPLPTSQPMARPAFNPFFDTIRQNTELSHGITERIPLRLPSRVRRRIADLPFRWLQEIARRAECAPRTHASHHHHHSHHHTHRLAASSSSSSSSSEDTSDSDTPDPAGVEEGTEALAMQFYRIELAEQRRLMGVMEHHSKESGRFVDEGITQASLTFPFSITAGVEKGAKNRYRHIWPFEHARVRLHPQSSEDARMNDSDGDDYVNASYVQPLGTTRRYIATQGPLPATFNDFWRLCWEQNVHVIVMLTREVEGSMVKCGSYWADDDDKEHTRTYGPLTLTLLKKEGLPGSVDLLDERESAYQAHEAPGGGGGFFGVAAPQHAFGGHPHAAAFATSSSTRPTRVHRRKQVTTIRRTFELAHARFPGAGARRVVHLQYLEWPDMNVPDDARGVLGLIKEVERAVEDTWEEEEEESGGLYPPKGENAKEAGSSGETVTPGKTDAGGRIGVAGVEVGRGELAVDEQTGIARHALGGKEQRPVLLHCSAGVGRTGGFIAVDAVLDAVRREMRRGKEEEGVKDQVEAGEEKGDDTMDVDEPGLVTVPLQVGGAAESGGAVAGDGGLVVHVPAVVVPATGGGDGVRTPMQVDEVGEGASLDVEERKEGGIATRKWAETVLDETGLGLAGTDAVAVPRPSSSSSTSASALPSMSDSDDSGGRLGLGSSSLGTSVSGTSEEEVGVPVGANKPAGTNLPVFALRHPAEGEDKDLGEAGGLRRGRGTKLEPHHQQQQQQQHQQHRTRTFSAPHRSHFRNRSIGGGIGSSPLAGSSRRDREREARRPFGGAMVMPGGSRVGVPGEGRLPEPPSRSMSPSGSASSSSVPPPLGRPRHPLSKSSPPILLPGPVVEISVGSEPVLHPAPSASLSTSPPDGASLGLGLGLGAAGAGAGAAYTPDGIVRSSFAPRATTVDYKEPRRLHAAVRSPARLSAYEEPIWEVVQDMREQRMSLCQSLRQYVFVHAAIIEGALGVVDEERARAGGLGVGVGAGVGGGVGGGDAAMKDPSPPGEGYFSFGAQPPTHLNFATPLPHAHAHPRESPVSVSVSVSSSSTGKRGASPTELLKEGRGGEVLLSKRPSIKRKHGSGPAAAGTGGVGVPGAFQGHAHAHVPKSQSLGAVGGATPVLPPPPPPSSSSGLVTSPAPAPPLQTLVVPRAPSPSPPRFP